MSRLKLHAKICKTIGSDKVYFQPPESYQMSYPCVVYSLSAISPFLADNCKYGLNDAYQVIYITKDPDSLIVRKMLENFKHCKFNRYYGSDNLHHFVFTIYDDTREEV